MKRLNVDVMLISLLFASCPAAAQSSWWSDHSTQANDSATQQSQPAPPAQNVGTPQAGALANAPSAIDKAECDAEVARAYPVNLWAPGLGKKRQELFDACIQQRPSSTATKRASSPAIDKAECDAEVAKAYPVNLWAPGLSKKRQELFSACMAQRGSGG